MILSNYFLKIFLVTFIHACASSTLDLMFRETLEKAMKCPSADKRDSQPVVALSPARYVQFVAQLRHDNDEISCNNEPTTPFRLNDPRSWGFCALGICAEKKCYCYESFTGDKCERFVGYCWLMYCRLEGCGSNSERKLSCVCNPNLYKRLVTSGEYWYDDGLKHVYYPPPTDFPMTTIMGSKIIYSVSDGRYDVRGANYNKYTINASPKHQRQQRQYQVSVIKEGKWQWINNQWQWVTPSTIRVAAPLQNARPNLAGQYSVFIPPYNKAAFMQLNNGQPIAKQSHAQIFANLQQPQRPVSDGQKLPTFKQPQSVMAAGQSRQNQKLESLIPNRQFAQKAQLAQSGQGFRGQVLPLRQMQNTKIGGVPPQQQRDQLGNSRVGQIPMQQQMNRLPNNQVQIPINPVTELKEEFEEGKVPQMCNAIAAVLRKFALWKNSYYKNNSTYGWKMWLHTDQETYYR